MYYPGFHLVLGLGLAHLTSQRIITGMSKEEFPTGGQLVVRGAAGRRHLPDTCHALVSTPSQTSLSLLLCIDVVLHGGLGSSTALAWLGDGEMIIAAMGWAFTMVYVNYTTAVLLQLSWGLGVPILTLPPPATAGGGT